MTSTSKKSILVFVSFLVSIIGFSQSNEIRIKFIGNCGLHMSDGNLDVYMDFPYKSGAFKYMEFDAAELDSIQENSIFIFTHKHADHYSSKNMRKVLNEKQGQKYGKWNIPELEALGDSVNAFSIHAFETKHRFSFKHYSYLVTWHGKRMYFSGDAESTEPILTMKNLDWAFVPYWIVEDVNAQEVSIDAKILGVYHFYPGTIITNSSPDTIKILDKKGERMILSY